MLQDNLLSEVTVKKVQNVHGKRKKSSNSLLTSYVRWYVLFVASLISVEQGWVWNSYGPIAITVEQRSVFNWDDGVVSTMGNWGPISYLVGFLPTAWMLDNLDLRPSAIVASALVCLGCGLRLIST